MMQNVVRFRDARDWSQFHTPKDLALALNVETGELSEHFLWKTDLETRSFTPEKLNEIALEMGDVFYLLLLLANDLNINLEQALVEQQKKLNPNIQLKNPRAVI